MKQEREGDVQSKETNAKEQMTPSHHWTTRKNQNINQGKCQIKGMNAQI